MSHIETNIYIVENLEELNCLYRTYKVRGISYNSDDYYKNSQLLVGRLSLKTRSPCILLRTAEGLLIAQPDGYEELPDSMDLVRANVRIERMPGLEELKFDSLDEVTKPLASRFLQFSLQDPLYRNPSLWQPRAGFPFYPKSPDLDFRKKSETIDLFRGFIFRVVTFLDGRVGICVDTRSKYVAQNPLPTKIDRNEFEKYNGSNCLYEYGSTWYEIRIGGLNDLNASELMLPDGISLFDHVHLKAGSKKSQNLLALPEDCSCLIYYDGLQRQRNVPSGLCRLTYSTDHPDVRPFHPMTIRPPFIRRSEIQSMVDEYLRDLKFHSVAVRLPESPLVIKDRIFITPDLKFGNGKVLSVRGTPNSIHATLKWFPQKKQELFYSNESGPFTRKLFDRQYLILPKSVYESFGRRFIEDVKNEVQRLFSPEEGISYLPIEIAYNDSVQMSVYTLGREIIKAVEYNDAAPGYGVVMIPRIGSRSIRKEDELANLVMSELRQRGIYVSVIHTAVPKESYEYASLTRGKENRTQERDHKLEGRFRGYLRNVVLNKILITNNYCPFVLSTPLNADLIIGIDVKNNTAGFTLVYKNGADIRFFSSDSDQKEQLGRRHMSTVIYDILKGEHELISKNIQKIVIHRQGRLFAPEREGIVSALNRLVKEGAISKDYECTFVDIRTTSRVPLRMFQVVPPSERYDEKTYNPQIGTYFLLSENDAFVCNTGYPYGDRGTTRPLHVIKIDGSMSIESILEDIFYLSNLTWTKIDDCSRHPLTIKMGDIRLREMAGEYVRDALRFGEEEE